MQIIDSTNPDNCSSIPTRWLIGAELISIVERLSYRKDFIAGTRVNFVSSWTCYFVFIRVFHSGIRKLHVCRYRADVVHLFQGTNIFPLAFDQGFCV